ncbi:MAG: hypothetical protein AAF316_00260 [Cyanobacteria bacterium P01_A01_bin.80]
METLPIPVQQGISINYETNVEKKENSKGTFYRQNNQYRKRVNEKITFTQYVEDLLSLRSFLIQHQGKPFLWDYTGKSYFCTQVSLTYLEETENSIKGEATLTLLLNTNE